MMKSEGKQGGIFKVLWGLFLGAFGVVCIGVFWSWGTLFPDTVMMGPQGPYVLAPRGPLLVGLGALVYGFFAAMTGVAQMIRPEYVLEDLWEVLPKAKLVEAVAAQPRPFYVCTRCRIVVKANETMGPCPRCDSGVDCHRVEDDDSARMVVSLLA